MRATLLSRLKRLEPTIAVSLPAVFRYGWLRSLPSDFTGESYVAIVKRERTKKLNVTCFFDEESIRPGDDVVEAIGNGLKTSKHVALLLSPESVKSRWVQLECASSLYEDIDTSARKLIPA